MGAPYRRICNSLMMALRSTILVQGTTESDTIRMST